MKTRAKLVPNCSKNYLTRQSISFILRMVRRAVTQKATDTMNSQEFRTAARNAFTAATEAHAIAFGVANAHQSYVFFKTAQDAYDAASAQWIADQHTADTMAQAELDAATAKGCEEVVEVVATEEVAEVVTTEATDDHLVANFGEAWGADGEVLSHAETIEAIKTGKGWFDTQGRWVNKAGWEKQHAHLSDWLTAKLVAN